VSGKLALVKKGKHMATF